MSVVSLRRRTGVAACLPLLAIAAGVHAEVANDPIDPKTPLTLRVHLKGAPMAGDDCEGGAWELRLSLDLGPAVESSDGQVGTLFDSAMPFSRVHSTSLRAEPFRCRSPDGRISEGQLVLDETSTATATVGHRMDDSTAANTLTPEARAVAHMQSCLREAGVAPDGSAVPTAAQQRVLQGCMQKPPRSPDSAIALQRLFQLQFIAPNIGRCQMRVDGQALPALPVTLSAQVPQTLVDDGALAEPLTPMSQGMRIAADVRGMVAGGGACIAGEVTEGTIELEYKAPQPDPEVTLDACLWRPLGEELVYAEGSPRGGQYRWRGMHGLTSTHVQPFGDQGQGARLALHDGPPRAIGIEVSYTLGQRTARASVEGALMALHLGAERLRSPIRMQDTPLVELPMRIEPAGAMSRVAWSVDDPSIVELRPHGDRLVVVPLRAGTATFQAWTACGQKLGQAYRVRVDP